MSDRELVITLPESLVEQAQAAHLDLQGILQRAVSQELERLKMSIPTMSMAEKEMRLRELLAPERLEEGLRLLREGKPIPGLHEYGAMPLGDEVMKPLPDEFWGNLIK